MGRKKMYFTAKEKKEAQRKWQMDYYYRNKVNIPINVDNGQLVSFGYYKRNTNQQFCYREL